MYSFLLLAAVAQAASSPVEAFLTEAFRGHMSVRYLTCEAPGTRARLGAARNRFLALEPRIMASFGKERIAELFYPIVTDPANIHTPGCPDDAELDRRFSALEQALAQLEASLVSGR